MTVLQFRLVLQVFALGALTVAVTDFAKAAEPSAQLVKALTYTPRQPGVEYERVERSEFSDCTIEELTRGEAKGFWVTGPLGQPLRWFADTNKDNKLDQWSYFQSGVEVYRESDSDFNGKADVYRWLGTGGTRKGIDSDEDASAGIDYWEMISAEEATSEVVAAVAARDASRFERLLITDSEIASLGLGVEKAAELRQRAGDAKAQFSGWAGGQNVVTRSSKWTNFGAEKPGLIPAGTDGSERDLLVYENVVALMEDGGETRQLLVGAMVRVGETWRLVELPKVVVEGAKMSGSALFFQVGTSGARGLGAGGGLAEGEVSVAMQRLVSELSEVDQKLQAGTGNQEVLQDARADVLEKLVSASASDTQERLTWVKQFAETVSAAAQTGEYPGGVKRLRGFAKKLEGIDASEDEVSFVVFRAVAADYNYSMQQKDAKYEVLQKKYLDDLVTFVRKYPRSGDSAEAMLQIALSAEFSGKTDTAESWYKQAQNGFRDSLAGQKAAGALRRLKMEGKPLGVVSTTIESRKFDSSALRGPVIYHSWASWCDGCKAEMRALKELQNKYATKGLKIVGMNFDNDSAAGKAFLSKNAFPWIHLYEEGGLDSKLAVSLGILTLPVNFVVDKDGRVVKTGVHWTELDTVISDMLK